MRRVAAGALLFTAMMWCMAAAEATQPSQWQSLPQSDFTRYPVPDERLVVYPAPWPPHLRHVRPLPTPEPTPTLTPKPTPKPRVVRPRTPQGSVRGVATWFCDPYSNPPSVCTHGYSSACACAAAGPELRAALGDWRGRSVYVNGVAVKLVDWCACGGDHVIDVFHAKWLKIPNPNHVVVTW